MDNKDFPNDETPFDLSIYQNHFYAEWEMKANSAEYNMCLAFDIHGPLNKDAFRKTLAESINHCENLRTYFTKKKGIVQQVVVDSLHGEVKEYDLSDMEAELAKKESDKILHDIESHAFDLHALPLFRYGLIRFDDEHFIFILNYHHIVCDTFSLHYVLDYISKKYNALAFGESVDIAALPKVKQYVAYEKENNTPAERDTDLVYWQQALSDVPLRVDIPDMQFNKKDKKRAASGRGAAYGFSIDQETAKRCSNWLATIISPRFRYYLPPLLCYAVDIRDNGIL